MKQEIKDTIKEVNEIFTSISLFVFLPMLVLFGFGYLFNEVSKWFIVPTMMCVYFYVIFVMYKLK